MSRRIFFCSVLQDEANTVARHLDSASKIAATIIISDGDPITPEPTPTMVAIEAWKKLHPRHAVHIIRREWRDFGYNKTWLLHDVRKLITQPNCYIAFCDGDEVFVTKPEDPTSYLTRADVQRLLAQMDSHPEFNVFQMQTILHRPPYSVSKYPRWQIIRNDQPYRWFMPHQEYLMGLKYNRTLFLNWIWNYSRTDGNSSRHPERRQWAIDVITKYVEEISKEYDAPVVDEFEFLYDELKMATDDILTESDDDIIVDISTPSCSSSDITSEKKVYYHPQRHNLPRCLFYLIDGYMGVDNDKALELLRQRAQMLDSDQQESYVTFLRIARLTTGKERRQALIDATYLDNTRLEAYYYLMKDCIDVGDNRRAAGWIAAAPSLSEVPSHAFAAEAEIYNWQFDYWASVALEHACRTNRGDPGMVLARPGLYYLGLDLLRKAIGQNAMPSNYLEQAKLNEAIYLGNVETIVPVGRLASSCTQQPSSSHLSALPRVAPLFSTLVVDGFYPNPDEIRQKALTMDYPVKGNYPGNRTKPYLVPGIKEYLETIVGRKITYWPTEDGSYNGSFQKVTAAEGWSSIHRDNTDYSVVIFLKEDAPIDSGTNVYQHHTGISKSGGDPAVEKMLNNDFQNDDAWDITISCGNLYNRAVFFDGRLSHKAGAYFGDNIHNCRLFQTFFFDVQK